MPPRKSNASTAAAAAVAAEETEERVWRQDGISIEDLGLPRTMVQRLSKGVLPPNTQVHKDALLAIQKSATVFISYLASHANENTLRSNKKTIQAQDVLDALREIEFEQFTERLTAEHDKFSSVQNDKRNSYRRKVKEEKLAAAAKFADEHITSAPGGGAPTAPVPSSPNESFHTANGAESPAPSKRATGEDEPAAKKMRREEGAEDEDEDMDDDPGEGEGDEDDEEEGDDDEVEEEEDHGDGADQLVEDPLEEREDGDEDESGDESD